MNLQVLPFNADMLPYAAMKALTWKVPRDSIVVIVKSAAKGLNSRHVELLKRRGAIVGLDNVDTPISEIDFDLFDFHIAASLAGQTAVENWLQKTGRRGIPVELLFHHADPRLHPKAVENRTSFRCGYIGMPENTNIPTALESEIEVLPVKYAADFGSILPNIQRLSFHYAVRPDEQSGHVSERPYKPFTKGVTAAACGANILVNKVVDDAVALLGDDYPYLVDSMSQKEVTDVFRKAKEEFGGPRWLEGLDRMQQLREAVSPQVLAKRVREIVDRVSELRRNS